METSARTSLLFYCYAHKDEALRDVLETHLTLLRRKGLIDGWHDRRIVAGDDRRALAEKYLEAADVILLLVSADFLASDYGYDTEIKRAMERHAAGEARVVPVILRPVEWRDAPFGMLEALPKDGKPITTWANQDEAWADVAKGIREVVERLRGDTGRVREEEGRQDPGAGQVVWFDRPLVLPQPDATGRVVLGPNTVTEPFRAARQPVPSTSTPPLNTRAVKARTAVKASPPPGPSPAYPDDRSRNLGDALHAAQEQLDALLMSEAPAATVKAAREEVLRIRRELREGDRLQAGDILSDRFLLLDRIGVGGFATVWKGFDRKRREVVALKVLHGQYAHDRSRIDRFFRGSRTMADLHHQHIVRVVEPELIDGGHSYFAMEYLPGGDFHQAVVAGRLDRKQVLKVILEVGAALGYAHQKGCIHRDVKPHNILLGQDGSSRLTDFDLVRVPDSTGGTRSGALGTFIYAAPEEMECARDVDGRADVFSLGMTAVFAFHGATLPARAFRNPEKFIAKLDCADPIKAVLESAVQWEAEERLGTMALFCEALEEAMTGRSGVVEERREERTEYWGKLGEAAVPTEGVGKVGEKQ